jgi:HAMP domain-containing protein
MATTLTSPPAARAERWNTLEILKASRIALVVLDGLLVIAAIAGARVHRDAMKTVGKDSAPSIIAAQHIKSALADMDADAANELLGAPGTTSDAVKAYESRRVEAAKALIAAAENITYGESERTPIQSLQVGMGTYERLIQRARDLHERGDAKFAAAYRDGAKLMDETLLPAADALDTANNEVLERTYEGQSGNSAAARLFLGFTGWLLLGALVAVQVFLTRRTRRTLNPLLVAATLLAAGTLQYTMSAMATEQRQLKVAKEDAFTSIHALWRARAVSYWANSDESRYLLDQEHSAEYERGFFTKSALLAKLPSNIGIAEVASAERNATHVDGFSGYLADELNNITFPGEREAAVDTLLRYEDYLVVDQQIRQFERGGRRQQAVDLCTGAQVGQSDWAFDRFDKALGATLDINQNAFEEAVGKGLSVLDWLEIKASVAAAAIAVLLFLGLAARIREYE